MGERKVAVLVKNLFTRVPVEAAVRAAGGQPVLVARPEDACAPDFVALVVDLTTGIEALHLAPLVRNGVQVFAFAPHGEAERLAQVRQVGGAALPRGAFLRKLPQLLAMVLS